MAKRRPQNSRIIEVVLTARTLQDAAALLEVNRRTLYDWLHEPTIQAELDAARRDTLRATLVHMHHLLGLALSAIEDCLAEDQPSGIRLAAARILLENVTRSTDVLNLDSRLAAIEARPQTEAMPERPRGPSEETC